MKLIQRLRDTYLSASPTHFHTTTKVYDYCPHCAEKRPWMVRVIAGFFRCLQCGNNPLDHDAVPHPKQDLVTEDAPGVDADAERHAA